MAEEDVSWVPVSGTRLQYFYSICEACPLLSTVLIFSPCLRLSSPLLYILGEQT